MRRFGLKQGQLRKLGFQLRGFIEHGRHEAGFALSRRRLKLKWFRWFCGRGSGNRFGMTAAHDIGVETFLNNGTGTGFHYRFPRYSRGNVRMFVKFVFDPLRLFAGEQA